MSQNNDAGEKITARFAGPVHGQVIAGSGNVQIGHISPAAPPPSQAEIEALRQKLGALKEQVAADAPADKRAAALERVEELQGAVLAEEPDLATMEYVKVWFLKNLPSLAASVASLVVHPLVGKLVEASGEALAAEFRRRFAG